MFESLSQSFLSSIESLFNKVLGYIPNLLGALVILIVGLIIASMLGKLAKKLAKLTRIDSIAKKIGLSEELSRFGINLSFAQIIGKTVKWFFVIATLIAVVDVLNINQLTVFLEKLVLYLPNVIVAIIILAVGLIIGKILKNSAHKALGTFSMNEKSAILLSNIAKWSVFSFALMAALVQLGVAVNLIQILFTGFIFMLSIAGGLAFGLGGREHAAKILTWIEGETGHNK